MLTSQVISALAADLTGAAAGGDAESLAAIAWRLYGEADENLAEIGRLRPAVYAAWTRAPGDRVTSGCRMSGSARSGAPRAPRPRVHQPGTGPNAGSCPAPNSP